jgi:hypothetical protein
MGTFISTKLIVKYFQVYFIGNPILAVWIVFRKGKDNFNSGKRIWKSWLVLSHFYRNLHKTIFIKSQDLALFWQKIKKQSRLYETAFSRYNLMKINNIPNPRTACLFYPIAGNSQL